MPMHLLFVPAGSARRERRGRPTSRAECRWKLFVARDAPRQNAKDGSQQWHINLHAVGALLDKVVAGVVTGDDVRRIDDGRPKELDRFGVANSPLLLPRLSPHISLRLTCLSGGGFQ